MSVEQFAADPRVRPLTALGPCRVAACARRTESGHGYCPTHYQRWRTAVAADPGTDRQHWQATQPAVSERGQVSLRGLAAVGGRRGAVRCPATRPRRREGQGRYPAGGLRHDAPPAGTDDRGPAGRAGARQAGPVAADRDGPRRPPGADRSRPGTGRRQLGPGLVRPPGAAVVHRHQSAVAGPARPRHGRSRNCPGTAAAAPARSGRRSTRWPGCRKACAPATITGLAPDLLGRKDIETFLNRLAYLESTGTISRYHRNVICRDTRHALSGIRALGLTRPGQVAAGLPGDFALGRGDIPAEPARGEPGRDLPPEIMAVLCAHLDQPAPGRGQDRDPDRHRHRSAPRRHPQPAGGLPAPRHRRLPWCWSTTTPRPTDSAGACRSPRPPPR